MARPSIGLLYVELQCLNSNEDFLTTSHLQLAPSANLSWESCYDSFQCARLTVSELSLYRRVKLLNGEHEYSMLGPATVLRS